MNSCKKYLAGLAMVALALAGWLGQALALDKFEADLKVKEASILVEKFMTSPDHSAPRWLLKRAKAVVIIPDMVKAGFIVGGKFGRGVVSARQADGSWSPPSFVTLVGANFGFQIGAESVDLFMLIMKQRGLDSILKYQMKVGVDASVAAGPVGRTTEAALSAASLNADIYSYSRSQGAYAGATLGGGGLEMDEESIKAYYDQALTVQDILFKGKAKPPASATELIRVLTKFGK